MTVIQKITAKGFKSFAKRTELLFGNEFNIILGPNGSGKSNVCDAICFVLGESSSKSLRAQKAANLIYHGGKKGSPAKEAEVSIVFNNESKTFPIDSKEITITRILKNSGNSVYKINNEKRTRQQVVDLLNTAKINPDGHNIILQGDIIRFMEMKPLERREILEDIAGISVYEDKKNKALNELEKVQSKLSEADIILTEREANLRELKKDRDQAKKYKELQSRKVDNKATLINYQIKEKENKRNEYEKRISEHNSRLSQINKKIEEIKNFITKKQEEISNINNEIEIKGEKEQLLLRSEIDSLKTDVIKHNSRIDVLISELNKIEERKKSLKSTIEESNVNIKKLEQNKKQIQSQIKEYISKENKINIEIKNFKERHDLQDISNINLKLSDLENNIDNLTNKRLETQQEKQENLNRVHQIDLNLQYLQEKIESLSEIEKKDKEQSNSLNQIRNRFKEIVTSLSKKLNEDSAFSAQLKNARIKLYQTNEQLARLRAQNIGIKEAIGGDIAAKRILSLNMKEIHGTVSSLATVPSKYNLALDVAAGYRSKSIVVDNDLIAAKCISYLKEKKLGIATFLPLNKIKSRKPVNIPISKNIHGLAVNLLEYDKKYKDVFSYVFGSTLVVENIETARRVGIGRIRMVTLEGDIVEPSGAMIGGFRRKTSGFTSKEVSEKISQFESESDRLSKIIKNVENNKTQLEKDIISLRENKAILEGEIIKIERSMGLTEDVSEIKNKKSPLIENKKQIQSDIKRLDSEIIKLDKEIINLRKSRESIKIKVQKPGVANKLNDLESQRQQFREQVIQLNSEIKNVDNQINGIFVQENEKTNKILKDLDKEREAFKQELNDLTLISKNKSLELKSKEKREQEFYGKFKNLAVKRNKFTEEIQKKNSGIEIDLSRCKDIESKIHSISIDKAKIVAEIEALQKEFEEFKEGTIRRGISLDKLKLEIREFEKMLNNLGNVNLRALEIYENLEKEHKILVEKKDKLKSEKGDVLSMIEEIEGKKTDIFMKTYKEIAKNFREIFNSLSSKGEATLELEDKEQPLNGGVDIKVKLIGKKYLDIRSLSGGEKTLAALSLIFSIQEYDPASFYLLDEVDAALDKHNSEKLSKLIAKYSSRAQYIVISHNDSIISEANYVYGTSMQDGITTVVSLKV